MVIRIFQFDAYTGIATACLKKSSLIDLKKALSFDLSVTNTAFLFTLNACWSK